MGLPLFVHIPDLAFRDRLKTSPFITDQAGYSVACLAETPLAANKKM